MNSLFLGYYHINAGPFNVNKSIVNNADDRMDYIKRSGKFAHFFEKYLKILWYKKVIISGIISKRDFYLLRFLQKRIYYIMHGDIRYENIINQFHIGEKDLKFEDEKLIAAHRIIAVSEKYSFWLRARYPYYSEKITFVNNGISILPRARCPKKKYTIALSGGNRLIKNNDVVCEAVSQLRKRGFDINVYVFGTYYDGNANLSKYPFVFNMGQMDKEQYYQSLDAISLFVLNSELESFGLVIGDALNCHCSLLISKNVGALSVLSTDIDDIIFDPHDTTELSSKILKLLECGNSERLLNSIERETVSEMHSYNKLMDIIANS